MSARTFESLLSAGAADHGDAPALADLTASSASLTAGSLPLVPTVWSYRALDELASRLATALIELGLCPGTRMAVLLPNCVELFALWFAAARARAVIVPLNPKLTPHERSALIAHSGASLIVGNRSTLEPHTSTPGVQLASIDGGVGTALSLDAPAAVGPLATAAESDGAEPLAVLYTSGSTGRPKGCVLTHDSFVMPAVEFCDWMCVTKHDRLLVSLPLFHVAGLSFATAAVAAGASVALVDRFSATRFWSDADATGATLFRHLGEMLALLTEQRPQPEERSHALRAVYGGGASVDIASAFERRFGIPVVEGYGLTETNTVLRNELGRRSRGSIGRPVRYAELRIVDERGAALPDGAVGEIQVRRNRVMMREYYGDPELTLAAFRDGWFATGDLGYRDAEGNFYFTRRAKDVIRRRGELIAAAEVEDVLNRHAAIRCSAVIPVLDTLGGEEVKAFVVADESDLPSAAELEEWCRRYLAEFKVPRFIEVCKHLPYTATSKLDKPRLRAAGTLGGRCFDLHSNARSRAKLVRVAAIDQDARWRALSRLASVLRRRAQELQDVAVELLAVSRRVAREDIALAEARLRAFPSLRPQLAGRRPLGTVALGLPGNAILSNPIATILSAVLAGNAVRVRIPRRRREWANRLLELFEEAHVPGIELLDHDGSRFVADAFVDPDVAVLMVFGADSWAADYEQAARSTATRFIFEGPGNDPFLVLDPDDVDTAARDAVEGAYHNAGQVCTSPERFYVVNEAYDRFLDLVAEYTDDLVVGDPGDERTDIGPMASPERAAHVQAHVDDALARGARVIHGGIRGESRHGVLMAPTVLADVTQDALVVREETFGPVIPVIRVASAQEAVEHAEQSRYGLTASVYGGPAWVPERLSRTHGTVFRCETWLGRNRREPLAPYGGRKASGWVWEWCADTFIRRDGPRRNLQEFSTTAADLLT